MKVLFICTGNTCRSPMAEELLRGISKSKGADIEVKSAGIFAIDGDYPSRGAVTAMKGKGKLSSHKAKSLNKQLLVWADIVLTMTQSQLFSIINKYPEHVHKVHLIKDYALGIDEDILDPYGRPQDVYEKVRNELEEIAEKIIEKSINEEEN